MEKKNYIKPGIELIVLDNEIALVLASEPPAGPEEGNAAIPFHFNNNPFSKNNLA